MDVCYVRVNGDVEPEGPTNLFDGPAGPKCGRGATRTPEEMLLGAINRGVDLKTFGEGYEDWRKNLVIGSHLDIDEVGWAMLASRVASIGKREPGVSESWNGFCKEGKTREQTLASFVATFGSPTSDAALQMNAVRLWTDELQIRTGWWFREDAAIYFSTNETDVDISMCCQRGSPVIAAVKKWAEEYVEIVPPAGTVYMMVMGKSGPKFHNVGKGGAVLARENYDPAVLAAYDRIKDELVVPAPRGRLTVLSGPPGCGKTYLIRGLLQEVTDALFVVCPQHALTGLIDPSGLTALTELRTQHRNEPVVLVLEDADDALAPRQEGDTSVISALLNLGDGITGSVLDMRIVATTNRPRQEFDAAILRPGRLSTSTEVGALSVEQANEVLSRLLTKNQEPNLTISPFTGPATIAEIYQRAYDSGWKAPSAPRKAKRMGFGGD